MMHGRKNIKVDFLVVQVAKWLYKQLSDFLENAVRVVK